MKTIVLMFGLMAFTLTMVNAQDKDDGKEVKNVPDKVKTEFAKLYPNVKDVTWNMEEGHYEGKFSSGGSKMAVHINKLGQLVEKEKYIKTSDLPKQAQDYLNKNYSGAKYEEVAEVTKTSNNTKYYEVETHEKELVFDTNGKFLKAEKEEE